MPVDDHCAHLKEGDSRPFPFSGTVELETCPGCGLRYDPRMNYHTPFSWLCHTNSLRTMKTALKDIQSVFKSAERMDMDVDEPEGARYIQVSDTLASQIVEMIDKMPYVACDEEEYLELERLAFNVNDVLKSARAHLSHANVNWASLRCVHARKTIEGGESVFRILVQGASPDNTELHRFLLSNLAERGWNNIRIVTEC